MVKVTGESLIKPAETVIPFWIPLIFALTLILKLHSILPMTIFATEVQYSLIKILLFTLLEDLSLFATVLLLCLLLGRIRFLSSFLIAVLLSLYVADTLLIRSLFSRLTIKQLYRYADELPAVMTFLTWWHLPVLIIVVSLIWRTRKMKVRFRKGRPAIIFSSLLIAALPWVLSGLYTWDPVIDYAFCNVLRINSKVAVFPGVSTRNLQQTETEFTDLAQELAQNPGQRIGITPHGQELHQQGGENNLKPNFIIVLSESLSRIDSKRSGGLYNRLPLIDDVASQGITLTNVIANGSNTSEALVSLLTGEEPYPTRMTEDSLKVRFPPLGCEQGADNLVCQAKKNGYRTIFISNAPLEFQQNRSWLTGIGFDRVEGGESEFFEAQPKASFGAAPDQFLFDRALSVIERQAQPFFLVLMTISLHRPYLVPEDAERISGIDFHNLLHYVDQTTHGFWEQLSQSGFFANGRLVLVGDHRRMTPLEPLELQETGVDSLGRVFGCVVGKGIPADRFVHTPLNLNDLMNILWVDLSGGDVDYTALDRFNKGVILGMGFPFTTHLLNIDLAQIQVRIPGRKPQLISLNRRIAPSRFADDPQMQQVVAYMILNAGRLERLQREHDESLKKNK